MTLRKISEYTCLAIFAMSAFSYTLLAQSSPLPTGTVSVASGTPSSGCPTSDGWLSGVTCRYATVTCPESNGTTPLGITFGYETPASPKGTIVIFSHSGGTTPEAFPGNEGTIAGGYCNANYQVVQTKWDSDWEDESGTGLGGSIGLAACRPATFLAWVISNLYTPIYNSNPTAGMCVHGTSAGASAAAYSLAWYGLYANIDKVTMVSGPPMGDIEEGCIEPVDSNVQVCPSGQVGCNPYNSPSSWSQAPKYTDALSSMRTWTGDSTAYDRGTCRSTNPSGTSATANAAWKAMSISDGSIGTFSYPKTNITSWLCANVYSSDGLDDGIMNDSSPEAQLFFQNFTSSSQTHGLLINAVTNCDGDEGAASTIAVPPSNYVDSHGNPLNGLTAVQSEMTSAGAGACTYHSTP
jgi:hypothetical protein